MRRRTVAWLVALVVVALIVAYQAVSSGWRQRTDGHVAAAEIPTLAPGEDMLAGVEVIPERVRGYDYRRAAFGETWSDSHDAALGRNGCDTRNDILDRDLTDKTYVSISRCPRAVATGTLRDPYTNATIAFVRGAKTGAAVQIDHLVSLALAWDLGARNWTDAMRERFANDPANLLAVDGPVNQDKSDHPPAAWMPPNTAFWCQYSVQFVEVLRGYSLPIDAASAGVVREAASTCPAE